MRHAGARRYAAVAASVVALVTGVLTTVATAGVSARPAESRQVTGCATIGQGATGAAVKVIQHEVNTSADGQFGPATTAALRKWQIKHHVPATGVVDAPTWSAFPHHIGRHACARAIDGIGTSCAALSSGSTGVAVGVLQHALGVTVDRQFGPQTAAALKAAQQRAKLPATGVTSVATWKALHREYTPACAELSADEKAQRKIRAEATERAAELEDGPGVSKNKTMLAAMKYEKKQIGKPYKYGATGPKAYDCSGLQMASYKHVGITIPRTAAEQYASGGKHVSLADARQGDLLFYASDVSKPDTVYHVVMYVGHGKILDAPYTGTTVQIQNLWTQDLLPNVVRPVG